MPISQILALLFLLIAIGSIPFIVITIITLLFRICFRFFLGVFAFVDGPKKSRSKLDKNA